MSASLRQAKTIENRLKLTNLLLHCQLWQLVTKVDYSFPNYQRLPLVRNVDHCFTQPSTLAFRGPNQQLTDHECETVNFCRSCADGVEQGLLSPPLLRRRFRASYS
jgi:hypothetical protein